MVVGNGRKVRSANDKRVASPRSNNRPVLVFRMNKEIKVVSNDLWPIQKVTGWIGEIVDLISRPISQHYECVWRDSRLQLSP